jgi:hypothetical protein
MKKDFGGLFANRNKRRNDLKRHTLRRELKEIKIGMRDPTGVRQPIYVSKTDCLWLYLQSGYHFVAAVGRQSQIHRLFNIIVRFDPARKGHNSISRAHRNT